MTLQFQKSHESQDWIFPRGVLTVRVNAAVSFFLFLLQASFGGNLRFALTASAPISPTVLSFLRATLGCLIFEGYGQTECTAGCTFSMPGDWSTGG